MTDLICNEKQLRSLSPPTMQPHLSGQTQLSPAVVPKDIVVEWGEGFLSLQDEVGAGVLRDLSPLVTFERPLQSRV